MMVSKVTDVLEHLLGPDLPEDSFPSALQTYLDYELSDGRITDANFLQLVLIEVRLLR